MFKELRPMFPPSATEYVPLQNHQAYKRVILPWGTGLARKVYREEAFIK